MGELSKRIGQFGEDTSYKFLERVGWINGQKGVSIECNDSTKHPNRESHGIDYLKLYSCPLIQHRLVHAIVSVKAKGDVYPKYPNTDLKAHIRELSDICNCYERDNKKSVATNSYNDQNIESESIVGVLIWLVSNTDQTDRDIIIETATARFEEDENFQFESAFVLDNRKAEFIWTILNHADKYYKGWNFLYIDTGMNYKEDIKIRMGEILPVEYINSSIIPIRYAIEQRDVIVLYTIDSFDEENLRKMIGLSNKISATFASEVIIAYSDFIESKHENPVKQALEYFNDQSTAKKIKVVNFNDYLIQ